MNTKLLAFCCFSLLCRTLSAQTFSAEYGANNYAKTVGTAAYSYDPNTPAPNVGGKAFSSGENYGPLDQSGISGRPDIVVFESPVFTEAMEFTGDIDVDLYFSTDVEDTQFVVKLVDVNPDTGFEALLRQGVCMARYQAGFGEDPATLPRLQAGVVYHLNFSLWAASHIVEPGHKLAVHITSAAAGIGEKKMNVEEKNRKSPLI